MNFNLNFSILAQNYLFAEVANRTAKYAAAHPEKEVLKLGIGDVTLPLVHEVIKAMHAAVDDMSKKETFMGYGPYEGYDFLRENIRRYYKSNGVELALDDIFVSDGAKSDLGNILDIFSSDNTVLIPDPVYPVYVDTNVIAGRKIIYANATEANGFLPMPESNVHADVIYICSPNNPTGAAYTKAQLKEWVQYANQNNAVILFDAAYECFINNENLARSIFQIQGARTCAIEFCSLSKLAGFTGTRCGYTVIPKELKSGGNSANKMWLRRQSTKFNGVPYIVQKGAAAVFTEQGQKEIRQNLNTYFKNAQLIAQTMDEVGVWYTGGKNSPYIWLKCPNNMSSWELFDYLLENAQVIGTPGSGFGKNGEGFFRLTAFSGVETTKKAIHRIKKLLQN